MAIDYTTTALIASARRRAHASTAAGDGAAAADILARLNESLQEQLLPAILRTRERHFIAPKDSTVSSGTATYAIPSRALGGRLFDVVLVRSGSDNSEKPLTRKESYDLPYFNQTTQSVTGEPAFFVVEGNNLVLWPTPGATYTLRMKYHRRPNYLVATSAVATITAINTGTKTITASLVPNTWTSSLTFDFIKGRPHFDALSEDQAATNVTSTTVTFSATLPTGLVVGDHVCLAGESPVAQVPFETHALLAQAVATDMLIAQGDPMAAQSQAKLKELEDNIGVLVSPRVDGKPQTIGPAVWFG